jgi:hypothetical protein
VAWRAPLPSYALCALCLCMPARVPPIFSKACGADLQQNQASLNVSFRSQGGVEVNFPVHVPRISPSNRGNATRV